MQAHKLFSYVMIYKYLALCYFYRHLRPGCNCYVPELSKFIVRHAAGLSTRNLPYAVVVHSVYLCVYKRCFVYQVIVLWILLLDKVRSATTLSIFRTLL